MCNLSSSQLSDYQVLFLIMTFMALGFMIMADHYYTKYKKLKRDAMQALYGNAMSAVRMEILRKQAMNATDVKFKQ
jgi:hypothetical protein